jgi:hypothetical protein
MYAKLKIRIWDANSKFSFKLKFNLETNICNTSIKFCPVSFAQLVGQLYYIYIGVQTSVILLSTLKSEISSH